MKIDWKRKLSSRKLWLAVTDFIAMLMLAFKVDGDTVTQVVSTIMAGAGAVAYIIAEGWADAANTETDQREPK